MSANTELPHTDDHDTFPAASGPTTDLDNSLAQLLSRDFYSHTHVLPAAFHTNFLPPLFAWNQLQGAPPEYTHLLPAQLVPSVPFPGTSQSAPLPQPAPQLSLQRDQRTSPSRLTRPRSASIPQSSPTFSTHSLVEPDDPNDEERVVEEKRKRNTAASARFRIKRKQKTINLERSVSDLSGRAEELEKEVADLRRENGWLKEIVMLRGSRYAAAATAQQREALSQAVKDAGINLAVDTNTPGTSAQRTSENSSDEESDSE